jgi:hypothetical protein
LWRTNARGESYPVFEAGTELLVNVGGVSVEEGDEAVLFLHGPAGTERLSAFVEWPRLARRALQRAAGPAR